MFRGKVVAITPKKEDIAMNMVLVVTTHNQIPKNVVFKEKELHKNKSLANWQEEEMLQHSFEEAIRNLQLKKPPRDLPRANIQTLVKTNLIGNYGSIPKPSYHNFGNLWCY
jgi:U3 small nucleolar ribonucleoprotein component